MDKRLIAARFAKARETYSREARVQQQVADKMLHLLLQYMPDNPATDASRTTGFRQIIEFGCGTGCYSRLLWNTIHPDSMILNDLCPEMKECIADLCQADSVRFMPGDAENMAFPPGANLITSCSTLQWFSDPLRFFVRCHQTLAPGGILAFSTFGKQNMREIRHLTGNGLEYFSTEELARMLARHFDILHMEEEIVTLPFGHPLQVLQHLRQTGVTGTEKRIWTRHILQQFCDGYIRSFGHPDGQVTLTYHPIYIIAKTSKQ